MQKLGKDRRSSWQNDFKSSFNSVKTIYHFTIPEKLFLTRYKSEMSLIFNLEDLNAPLACPSYFSSDEPMKIDSVSVAISEDVDVQVIACSEEQPIFPGNTLATRNEYRHYSVYV